MLTKKKHTHDEIEVANFATTFALHILGAESEMYNKKQGTSYCFKACKEELCVSSISTRTRGPTTYLHSYIAKGSRVIS